MRPSPKKSMSPAVAAKSEKMRPITNSHAEISAHSIAAVRQYTMSVTSVATKQTMGKGTIIAWRGRLQRLTVARALILGTAIYSKDRTILPIEPPASTTAMARDASYGIDARRLDDEQHLRGIR